MGQNVPLEKWVPCFHHVLKRNTISCINLGWKAHRKVDNCTASPRWHQQKEKEGAVVSHFVFFEMYNVGWYISWILEGEAVKIIGEV